MITKSNTIVFAANGVGINTASPNVTLDVSGSKDAIALPIGNTLQRPAGANGMLRYNSQSNAFEGFISSAWSNIGGGGGGSTAPHSPNLSVQINVAGSFFGTSNLLFDDTAKLLSVGGNIAANGTIFANGKPTYNANAAGVTIGNDTGFGVAVLTAAGSTTDQNTWQVFATPTGQFKISTLNDPSTFSDDAIVISRIGSNVSAIALNATIVSANTTGGSFQVVANDQAKIVIASNTTQPAFVQFQSNAAVGGYIGVAHSTGDLTGGAGNGDYVLRCFNGNMYANVPNPKKFIINSGIVRESANGGWLEGRYAQGGETANTTVGSGTTTGVIYCLGGTGPYVPNFAANQLGAMYGIGFTYGNQTNVAAMVPTPTADWGFYVASAGIPRIFLGSGDGIVYSTGGVKTGGDVVVPNSALSPSQTQAVTGLAGLNPAAAPKTSNTTLAASGALTLTFNETGWYEAEIYLPVAASANGLGGFKWDIGANTAHTANIQLQVTGFSNVAIGQSAAFTSNTFSINAPAVSVSTAAPSWWLAKGSFTITAAGTLAVRWAQNTSSANAVSLLQGAYFKTTKIG